MLAHSGQVERLDKISDRASRAPAVTRELLSDLISAACERLPVLDKSGKAAAVKALIQSGAWTDAALALIELELPQWKVRRLVHEDGNWLCSLSRQPNMPPELDDTVDASHEQLSLAMLSALIEARRRVASTPEPAPSVPQVRSACAVVPYPGNAFCVVCCDSFS